MLWFDVEMIRYTTIMGFFSSMGELWFDVEMIRYTTEYMKAMNDWSCGLM